MDKVAKSQTVGSKRRLESSKEEPQTKTPADITRAEIKRRMHEDPCDPERYGELTKSGHFTPAFYNALGSLVALMAPVALGMDEENDAYGNLLKKAKNHLNMDDSETSVKIPAEAPATIPFEPSEEEILFF